jgi:carbon-monoxide dehydrogenase medium subunit
VARRSGDFALAGAACGVALARDATIERAAIALFGMGNTPLRAPTAEAAARGRAGSQPELQELGRLAVEGLEPPDDVHASSRYRRAVGAHVVALALGAAVREAAV